MKAISLGVLALGLGLMTMMIVTESEPGAIPLLLVLLGAGGCAYAWRRAGRRED